MAFVSIPGITGKVFIPEGQVITARKHPCIDCFSCQQCSDDRCALCRCEKTRRRGVSPDCRIEGHALSKEASS